MNARSIFTIALATVVVLAALTGPAAAKKYGGSQAGHGTDEACRPGVGSTSSPTVGCPAPSPISAGGTTGR